MAEGVRIYNQETWRHVTGGDGRQLVETFISSIVSFFIFTESAFSTKC